MKNKKVLKIILNVFIWIFVAFSAFMTVLSLAASTSPDGIPSLAGNAFMTVASDSMEDTIMTGDLITAKKLSDTEKQQLEVGDVIIDVDGTRVYSGNEVLYEISNKGYEPIDILVKRNGEKLLLSDVVFPTSVEEGITFGTLDFKVLAEERTFGNLMKQSFTRSLSTVKMVIDSLIGLFNGRFGINAVSGPIGVAEVVGKAAKTNVDTFLYIAAILTINLGVFNLIPFPALDGGRFLFLIIEGIRRKPINKNLEAYINFGGIIILFAFMIFVSFKDVMKLIFR
jgi:regulator of sigma E protease